MSEQRSRKSRRDREEDDPGDVRDQTKKPKSDKHAPAIDDEILDDIERVLKETLLEKGEKVEDLSRDEFDKRSATMVKEYINKGGQ